MISQRLRGLSEDGEAVDGLLPKLEKQFASVGISIQDQNGDLRSSFEILQDLAGVWDQLSSKQKQYFGEKVAGNRQVKTLNAIMQNWDVVADTIDKANNAQGAAIEGNEMYMESIAGKVTELKSAWQELATTTINGDFVKGFVELGTAVVRLATNMGGLIPVASTLLGIFTMFKGKAIADGFAKLLPALSGVFATIRNGTPVLQAFMSLLNTPIGVVGGLMALVGIFAAVVNAINKAYYSLENFENAKKAYEEHSSKVSELNEELKNTENAIDTLEGKDSLTIVEQAELNRLKETNGELERQLEIEKKLKEIAESGLRNEAVKAAEKYNAKASESDITYDMVDSIGAENAASIIGMDIRGLNESEVSEGLMNHLLTNYEKAQLDMELLKKAREDYNTAYEAFLEASPEDIDATSKYQKEMEDRAKEIESLQIGLNAYNDSIKGFTAGLSRTEEDSEFNAFIDIEEQIDNLITDDSNISFEEAYNKILNKYSDATEAVKEKVQEFGDAFTLDSLKDAVNEQGEDVDFDPLVNEIATKLNLTRDEVEQLFKETFSFDSANITPSFNIGLDDITLFSTTESYKNLTAAMTEQQKAGVLSYETIKTLLGDEGLKGINDYLIQTADGYMLNTNAVYDFIKSEQEESKLDIVEGIMERQIRLEDLQEQMAALGKTEEDVAQKAIFDEEQKGIEAEITQLKAAALAADEATGALERFNAASKTANQDAAQDEGENAFKTVQERYKEGKVGTDEFKEGMNFLLGDNWKETFKGDIDAAYKEAQQIGKKYFGDNDAKSADNFRKDLIDKGLATYDEASGKLTLVQNDLTTIADTLGISENAAESLFGLLNSYSPDEQFTFDKPIVSEEQIEVARKKYEELQDAQKKAQEELDGMSETDPGYQEKAEELANITAEAEKLGNAITVAEEALDGGFEVSEDLTLEQALEQIQKLQEAITTLRDDFKITPVVKMTAEYNQLISFLTGKDSEGNEVGFTMNVTGVEDAESKITQIDNSIANIKQMVDNGTITATLGAKIIGNFENQQDALETYISQASELKEAVPGGDLSATITVDATDNATPTISFVNQELFGENGVQGIDGKAAKATLEATDNASGEAKKAKESIEDIPDDHETDVTADADDDSISQTKSDIEEGVQPEEPATVFVRYDDGTYSATKKVLDDLSKDREITYTINTKQGTIEPGEGTSLEDIVNGTDKVLSKNNDGSYSYGNLSTWLYDYVNKGGAPNTESAKAQFAKELESGNIVADSLLIDQIDAAQATLSDASIGSQTDLNGDTETDVDVDTNVDEDDISQQVGDAVEKGAKDANPEVEPEVDPKTDDLEGEIKDATPENVTTEADADTSKMPEQIEEAAESAGPVETEVNAKTTLNPPEPPEAGGKAVSYSATMSMDTSSASSSVNAVQSDASEDQSFTLDANTNPADTKVDKTHKDAKKDESFTVNTNVNRRELDNLYSDLKTKKTQEVEVKYTEVDKPTGLAVGTKNAPGGLSLVDEEGAELIEHTSKGTFELGTNNGARFTRLDKGDVVHTASETKRILSRMGKLGGFFRDGLNQAKSIFGNAFAGGSGRTVDGSAVLSALDRVLKRNSSGSSKGSSRNSNGSNSDKALKKFEKWAAKLFDWAEIRLDRLKTITNTFLLDASNAIGYIAKNNNLDSALKSVNNEISATEKAYAEYIDTADKVAKKAKLSDKIIQKIQDGTIDVEKVNPNMQKKIKQYQEWFEKAKNCQEALQDLKDQEKELAKTELDNIVKDYEYISDIQSGKRSKAEAQRELNYESGIAAVGTTTTKVGNKTKTTYGDYQADINAENKNLNNLINERTALQEKLQSLMDQGLVVKKDDTWKEMQKQIQSLDTAILNSQADIIKLKDEANNVKIDQLGYQIDEYATSVSRSIEEAELSIARGSESMDDIGKYYESAISGYTNENKVLAEQNKLYAKQQTNLDKASAKYQELQKKIDQNNSTMKQNSQSIQENLDKLNQIKLDKLSYQLDELSDSASKYNDTINENVIKGIRITAQSYQNLINNGNKQIDVLKSQKAVYKELNDAMVAQYGSQAKESVKYKENEAAIRDLDSQIRQISQSTLEWGKAIEGLAIQELDWKIADNEATTKGINETISLMQAAGQYIDRNWYDRLITNADKEIQNLEEQNKLYQEQRKDMHINSQAYQELTDKIRDNNSQIRSLKTSTEEWKDAISDLSLDKYSHALDNLKVQEESYNDEIAERQARGLRITENYYQRLIDNGNKQIENIINQRAYYKNLMDAMVDLYGVSAKQSDKYKELEKAFYDLGNSLRDTRIETVKLAKEMENLKIQELSWEFDALAASADRMNSAISLHEAQGIVETSKSYKELIDNGMEQINILEQQNALYRQQQKGMDVMSDEYQELEGKIRSNISAIEDMKVSQEQWNDSIIDIGISQIEKQRDLLSKTNDEYERQEELQKALLNLEKARTQRKVRTYVEGQGFVYQSSEDDLREAQEALEDVISNQLMDRLDMLIDALEESKNDTNVYDANGNLLGKSYSTPQLGTLTNVLSNYEAVRNTGLDIAVLKDSLGRNILNTTGTNTSSTSFNIGDIIVNEAKDGNELAQAIVNQFPSALIQALYKK